jgi:hypothetical protein
VTTVEQELLTLPKFTTSFRWVRVTTDKTEFWNADLGQLTWWDLYIFVYTLFLSLHCRWHSKEKVPITIFNNYIFHQNMSLCCIPVWKVVNWRWIMIHYTIVTRRVSLVEQELFTLTEHLSSPCIVLCRPLFAIQFLFN